MCNFCTYIPGLLRGQHEHLCPLRPKATARWKARVLNPRSPRRGEEDEVREGLQNALDEVRVDPVEIPVDRIQVPVDPVEVPVDPIQVPVDPVPVDLDKDTDTTIELGSS